MTFRWKLVLGGIAAVLLPFLVAGAVTYYRLSVSLKDLSRQQSLQIAIDVSTFLQQSLARELYVVSAVAREPGVISALRAGEFRGLDARLASIHRTSGAPLGTIFLTDERGIIRADAKYPRGPGTDVSDRVYFINAKKGNTYVDDPIIARVTGKDLINVIAAPVYDGDGRFLGVAGIAMNIRFLLQQLNLRKVGETGYVFAVDSKGTIIAHPDEKYLLKANIGDLPGMEDIARRMIRRETGSFEYTFQGTGKIGGFAPVDQTGWSVAVVQDEREVMAPANAILDSIIISGLFFLAITIAGIVLLSKRISSPVQKAVETLKQITLHSGEAVISIGPDRKIESVNPAVEKLLKRPATEIVGTKPVLRNQFNVPEERIWQTLDEGNVWTGRLTLSEEPAGPVVLDTMIIPIRDKGAVSGYLEIGRDITREQMIDTRLQQAQKMEAIGVLAGGIAHDFNNVLSGIFGYSELAMASAGDPDRLNAHLREVRKAADRARDLVKQILTFSRQAQTELEEVAPKQVVAEALKLLRASIPATIELRAGLGSDSVIVANPTHLHQVVMNLCTNAVYSIKDGKGAIEVGLEDLDVDAEFAALHPGLKPGRHVRLRVADTGCGMTPEVIRHIFDPFFTTKPRGEGTGLGLSVVHGIVRAIGGVIAVQSEPGKGTTFDVIVPAAAAGKREGAGKAAAALPRGSGRILFVDDEEQIVNAFSAILGSLGYEVTPFTAGRPALEALRAGPDAYDLVITDYTMPKMTGIEIAAAVREIRPDIPVILCSGFVHDAMEEAARRAGVRETLMKPLGAEELAAAIRRVLAGR